MVYETTILKYLKITQDTVRQKKGRVTQEEYRDVIQESRYGVGKTKAHPESNLARDVKCSKRSFCRYISSNRKTKENVGPLLNGASTLVTKHAEKQLSGIPGP